MLESASLMIPSFTLFAFAVVCAAVFPDRRVNNTTPAKIAIIVRLKDPREQVAIISPALVVDFPAQKDAGDRGAQQLRVSSPSRSLGVMIFHRLKFACFRFAFPCPG